MAEIESIDLNIETLNAKKRQLKGQLETLSPTIESVFSVGDVGEGFENNPQLASMEKKLSNLRLRYTDNYPEIVRLKFEIDSLRNSLETSQGDVVAESDTSSSKMTSLNPLYLDVQQRLLEIQSELTTQQSRKQSLQRTIAKREKELHEVPEGRKELKVLIDERNSYQKIYQDLLARMGQSEVSKQMEIGNKTATFRVVDPAVLPQEPVSPNMMKMVILAIAAGLGSAAGLIFLLENLDGKVRDVDFFKGMGFEVLAVVPNIVDPKLQRKKRRHAIYFFSGASLYFVCFVGFFGYVIFL